MLGYPPKEEMANFSDDRNRMTYLSDTGSYLVNILSNVLVDLYQGGKEGHPLRNMTSLEHFAPVTLALALIL